MAEPPVLYGITASKVDDRDRRRGGLMVSGIINGGAVCGEGSEALVNNYASRDCNPMYG